jgi:hypothetical protein
MSAHGRISALLDRESMDEWLRRAIPMRLTIYSAAALLVAGTTLSAAQDTTVKSRTQIEGDEAQVVGMTGCLRQDAQSGAYMLVGSVDAVGENVTNDAKVKVDRDKDNSKVTAECVGEIARRHRAAH